MGGWGELGWGGRLLLVMMVLLLVMMMLLLVGLGSVDPVPHLLHCRTKIGRNLLNLFVETGLFEWVECHFVD